ncbi:E3 ubiquitin-protein ligase AMFR-like isoform X2 [Danio rerio]|uniref:Autocrine motility factor receptor b n=1 Tax=Danio rerio TaxID=7955 RepID=A0A2R8QB56_DANRE|nr:E3 ubiquitin-protein ligase AMFR isoform X1 [Danio rerio]|eukprot:XP_017212555.1 E3 ubiquitin-protein ligase AMFR isoform X1 [Danio rerio]
MDVLSWPCTQAYTAFSACLLTGCIYSLYDDEDKDLLIEKNLSQDSPSGRTDDDNVNNEELYSTGLWCHTTGSLCMWVLVNTLCCFLLLMGKCIQLVVFGDLRINEKQNLKDKTWNFLFNKLIFLFGVLNVRTEREMAMWCLCFSALLFLQLLAQLCKDRFEFLSSSPSSTALGSHMHLLLVLMCLFVSSGGLTIICVLLGFSFGMHTLSFMAVELYGNVWFSVADLFILTHIRFLAKEMQRKLFQHKNYMHIYDVMDTRFSMATMEELASRDDRCVICWEKMYTAYKLPCGHLFHKSCLRSWLEQNMSCPTCRMSVNMSGGHTGNEQEGALFSLGATDVPSRPPTRYHSQLFHFNGSQISNWLPGFSVEVLHSPNLIILLQADDSRGHQDEEIVPGLDLTE